LFKDFDDPDLWTELEELNATGVTNPGANHILRMYQELVINGCTTPLPNESKTIVYWALLLCISNENESFFFQTRIHMTCKYIGKKISATRKKNFTHQESGSPI